MDSVITPIDISKLRKIEINSITYDILEVAIKQDVNFIQTYFRFKDNQNDSGITLDFDVDTLNLLIDNESKLPYIIPQSSLNPIGTKLYIYKIRFGEFECFLIIVSASITEIVFKDNLNTPIGSWSRNDDVGKGVILIYDSKLDIVNYIHHNTSFPHINKDYLNKFNAMNLQRINIYIDKSTKTLLSWNI